jgi:hypothetical protein
MRNGLFSTTAIAGLVATLAALPAPANANRIIAVTVSSGGRVTSSGADISPTTLSFPEFNPANGTLESVLVVENLSGTYKGKISGSTTGTVSLTIATGLNISGGPSVLDGNPALKLTAGTSVAVTNTTNKFAFTTSASTSKSKQYFTGLSSWEGAGTIDVTVGKSTTTLGTNPSAGFAANVNPTLTFTMVVDYSVHTSSPAPEPTSLLMLGSGIIALGAAQRRRRRRPPG